MYTTSEIKTIIANCNTIGELQKALSLIIAYQSGNISYTLSSWLTAAFMGKKFNTEKP